MVEGLTCFRVDIRLIQFKSLERGFRPSFLSGGEVEEETKSLGSFLLGGSVLE